MSIKGYKAFNRGMICKGKQYEKKILLTKKKETKYVKRVNAFL